MLRAEATQGQGTSPKWCWRSWVARGEPKPIRRAFGVARGEPRPIRRAFGGARGEPRPIRRAFGVARGEPRPIRRAFAAPSWLRSLVHSRFRPPGCARLQGRLIRPGLTPRLRCLRPAHSARAHPSLTLFKAGSFGPGSPLAYGLKDGLFAALRRSAAGGRDACGGACDAQAGRVFGCRRHLGYAEAASRPEDPSRSLSVPLSSLVPSLSPSRH